MGVLGWVPGRTRKCQRAIAARARVSKELRTLRTVMVWKANWWAGSSLFVRASELWNTKSNTAPGDGRGR